MSRQTHTKSRSGCQTCKARKVKCDEERPICRNCIKRGVPCDFPVTDPVSVSSGLGRTGDSTKGSSTGFSMFDMELLHHYTTSTSLTFSNDAQSRMFWKITVPQIAFSNPFLMKSILAVTAQHYSHLNPERKETYLEYAMACHKDSSSTMQVVSQVTEENYPALLSFTWMNIYYAFARPKNFDFLVVEGDAVPDWLILFRGVRNMTGIGDYSQYPPIMNVLMNSATRVNLLWESCSYENEAFDNLLVAMGSHIEETTKLETLRDAIQALKRSYALVFDGSQPDDFKLRATFIWLFKMSDDYLGLLADGNSEALCVLAFFCVLLQRLDFYWWMKGWAWHLIHQIHSAIRPEQWPWIQWPVEEIGWAPKR